MVIYIYISWTCWLLMFVQVWLLGVQPVKTPPQHLKAGRMCLLILGTSLPFSCAMCSWISISGDFTWQIRDNKFKRSSLVSQCINGYFLRRCWGHSKVGSIGTTMKASLPHFFTFLAKILDTMFTFPCVVSNMFFPHLNLFFSVKHVPFHHFVWNPYGHIGDIGYSHLPLQSWGPAVPPDSGYSQLALRLVCEGLCSADFSRWWTGPGTVWKKQNKKTSRELTYPTLGKGKTSTQKCYYLKGICWFPSGYIIYRGFKVRFQSGFFGPLNDPWYPAAWSFADFSI